ncbi:uncharacterized protein LOC135346083 isoform X2 [Halichondria panicea]|uniref:uncharacterized protein LOC135346083 isoform X2 n=1 Tax=Halichondria panicea TaxID=6063 RepID=UPI00312B8067
MSDNGLLENANTRTCYQDAKSDQSDDDLVSLSSAESESSHFSDNNEIDQTTQPHPPSVATENTEHPSVATETTEHTQTDNCSVSSDGWFKVEANVTETTPTQPLPMVGQSNSQGTESCASSAKTVEVLSSSVQDPSSFTSLEDTETETGSIVSASPLPQTEDAATSLSSIEELRRNQQQDTSVNEEQLATGGEVGRTGTEETDVASGGEKSGRMSPYLMINKEGNIARVTEFESPGLLYARPTSKNNKSELVADEVAVDVLEKYDGEEGAEVEGEDSEDAEENSYEVGLSEGVSLIDPDVLGDLERRAKVIAGNLNHVMDNLRNSLHAL